MRRLAAVLVTVATACSGTEPVGMGPRDAGPEVDSGTVTVADAGEGAGVGHRDASTIIDAGFSDPDTVFEGRQDLAGVLTWLEIKGTETSTMPPLIILHSGPAISHEYLPEHIDAMVGCDSTDGPATRLCVYYDMRATGLTSFGSIGSSTVTLAQHALDLVEVVEFSGTFGNNARVDLLGHGYGAAVASLYAADNPGRVSRLLLTAPFPADQAQLIERTFEGNRRLTGPDRQRQSDIMNRRECLQNISQCFLQLWNIWGPKTMCPENRDRWFDLTFRHGEFRAQVFVETELRDSTYDLAPTFRRITTPTTIISGACDTTLIESSNIYASEIADSVHHVLPDSGHFPMVETSTTYQGLLRSALIYP